MKNSYIYLSALVALLSLGGCASIQHQSSNGERYIDQNGNVRLSGTAVEADAAVRIAQERTEQVKDSNRANYFINKDTLDVIGNWVGNQQQVMSSTISAGAAAFKKGQPNAQPPCAVGDTTCSQQLLQQQKSAEEKRTSLSEWINN